MDYIGRREIIIFLLIFIVLVLFFTFKFFQIKYSQDKVFKRIDRAIVSRDYKYLSKLIRMEDGSKLDDKTLEFVVDFLDEGAVDARELYIKTLDPIQYRRARKSLIKSMYLIDEGRKFFVFRSYSIYLKYMDIIIRTNLDPEAVGLALNNERLENFKFDKETGELVLENLLPGQYDLDIFYGKDQALKERLELDLIGLDKKSSKDRLKSKELGEKLRNIDNKSPYQLDFKKKASYIELGTNIEKELGPVFLHIDGMESKISLSKGRDIKFGPIYEGEDYLLRGVLTQGDKLFYSEEIYVDAQTEGYHMFYVDYNPFVLDEAQAQEFLESYTRAYYNSVNYGDLSFIESHIHSSSNYLDKLESQVRSRYDKDISLRGLGLKLESLERLDDSHYKARAKESYRAHYPDGSLKDESRTRTYFLIVQDYNIYIDRVE